MKRLILFFSVLLIGTSCINEIEDPSYVDESAFIMVPVNILSNRDSLITKSSISPTEDKIADYSVLVYQKGVLVKDLYVDSDEASEIPMYLGQTYSLYVLANVGDIDGPEREEDIISFTYSVPSLSSLGQELPMAQCYGSVTVSETTSFEFVVERLVAKVVFNMRDLGVSGLKVESVNICQAPSSVRPFAEGGSKAASSEVSIGDKASSIDIETLNNGGDVYFYVFENVQGTLLPQNDDPWKKTPDNISVSDACTYLETVCRFDESVSAREGTVTYRMYLGEDNISNFDIKRNKIISVSLKATEEGLFKSSWKVVSDYIQHVTSVTLDKDNVILPLGETVQLNAVVKPDEAKDKSVIWKSSDSKIASVSDMGVVTPLKTGTCTIVASSNDSPDIWDECVVTVKAADISGIKINNGDLYLLKARNAQSAELTVTAEFKDGSIQTLQPSAVRYSTSDTHVATVNSEGKVVATGIGIATISASYEITNAAGTSVTVTDQLKVYVSSLSLESEELVLNVGKTTAVQSILTDFNGQTKSTSSSWKSGDLSVAKVVDGTITAVAVGTTAITASYSGEYGIGEAVVSIEVINELYSVVLSPEEVTIDHGEKTLMSATGRYHDGSTVTAAAAFTWKSLNPDVATVDANGIVTGINTGTAIIVASKDGLTSNECIVTVKASVSRRLTLSCSKTSGKIGDSAAIKAVLYTTTDGVVSEKDVTSLATWSVDDSSVASVNGGTIKGLAAGDVVVSAVYEDCVGVFSYTVINMIDSIIINPLGGTYEVGQTVQMSVKGTYQDGTTTTDVSLFTWTSSDPTVASVSASGKVTMNKAGMAEIKASKDGIVSNLATFEPYVETTKDRLILTGASELNVGSATTLTVNLYTDIYRNGELYSTDTTPTVISGSSCSWSSLNTAKASVNGGVVSGLAAGIVTIKVTYNSMDATIQITIKDVIEQRTRIVLSYSKTRFYVNESVTPTVTRYTDIYTNGVLTQKGTTGSPVTASACSWTSSNSSIRVSTSGVARGFAAGTATITATCNGSKASVVLTAEDKITYSYALRLEGASAIKVGTSGSYLTYLETTTYKNGTVSDISEDVIANNKCQWSSSSVSIAQVSLGIVTGNSNGTVTITAKWINDTSVTASVSLTVNSSSTGSDWEEDEDDNIEL